MSSNLTVRASFNGRFHIEDAFWVYKLLVANLGAPSGAIRKARRDSLRRECTILAGLAAQALGPERMFTEQCLAYCGTANRNSKESNQTQSSVDRPLTAAFAEMFS